MQKEIFFSYGYSKFITQKDGSMDLLVQLAAEKAKALTYAFNNSKVKKIVKIQQQPGPKASSNCRKSPSKVVVS